VIGGDGNVRRSTGHHAEDGRDHGSDRANFASINLASGRDGIKMPEQLVGAINQIDFQATLQDNY